MMKSPSSNRRKSGFTLLELMVAMGITAVIVTVLVTVTGVATDTWTRSRSEIRASRQAKVMLDTMAKDLESFVSRRGNQFEWFYANLDTNADLPKVARDQSGDTEVAELTFFTAATDRYLGEIGGASDKGGDISCVSYRMRYQDPIDGMSNERTSTFVLYRMLVNPDETFEDLLGEEDLKQAFSSKENDVTEQENFVCENISQLTVTFLVEVSLPGEGASGPRPQTVRVTLGSDSGSGEFRIRGSGIDTDLTVDASGVTQAILEAGRLTGVELSISVISDAGLARLNTGAGNQGLNEKDYARQVFHYSRVVELPGM